MSPSLQAGNRKTTIFIIMSEVVNEKRRKTKFVNVRKKTDQKIRMFNRVLLSSFPDGFKF